MIELLVVKFDSVLMYSLINFTMHNDKSIKQKSNSCGYEKD
jgi:hypothetical protein